MHALKLLLTIFIPLASFLTGLRAAGTDWLWLWKRPGLLVRSLLAILVLVPVASVLLLQAMHASLIVKSGIIAAIFAIGLGPAAAFKRIKTAEETLPFEIGLDVTLLLLSVIFMPLAVAIYGAIFHNDISLAPGRVATVVLTKAIVPLCAGVLAARIFPKIIAPAHRYGGFIINGFLALVLITIIAVAWRELLGVGAAGWLACVAVVVLDIAIGHFMGGPDPAPTRGVLASFSAMRFPALALLLVSVVPQGRPLVPVVAVYVIVSSILVMVYAAVMTTRERRHAPPVPAPANA
jgi:bile acid:Na+ symporter, BASS family